METENVIIIPFKEDHEYILSIINWAIMYYAFKIFVIKYERLAKHGVVYRFFLFFHLKSNYKNCIYMFRVSEGKKEKGKKSHSVFGSTLWFYFVLGDDHWSLFINKI